jgi:hypothetical protein
MPTVTEKQKGIPSETEEFLNKARDRFKLAAESEAENRRACLDDLEFSIGNQWPMDIKAQRQLDGRPCLTTNLVTEYLRQVTNEQRQQKPSAQVNPVGDGADIDTAEIIQGVYRHIEVNSRADVARQYAYDHGVRTGFGHWRVLTDWISPESEDQEIYIKRIPNQFAVYWDPTAAELDNSDAKYCFIVEDLLADDFKNQFPDSEYGASANLSEYESIGDSAAPWAQTIDGKPHIRIAEYFWVDEKPGDKGRKTRKVNWAKISGLDILDERDDYKGTLIPIITFYGENIIVNGKKKISGLVRGAKDPARQYNFWNSALTERISLSPKAPWLAYEGQLEGHEREWEQSNVRNMAVLTRKAVMIGGQLLPGPERNVVEPGVQGMAEMLTLARTDLQATTGLNDANVGRPKPDESGKAVMLRQKQGDVSTLNYSDNLSVAMDYEMRVVFELMPEVYSASRIQRIIKPDGTVSYVGLYNSKNEDEDEAVKNISAQNPEIQKIYDIGTGRYDVTFTVGPSYQSRRQQAAESMLALVNAVPQIMPAIGDLIVGDMDWPQAKEISKRLKKLLPPQLQDSEDQSPEAQLQQAQQQLAQLGSQHAQLTKLAQDQQQIINTKQVEQQGKFAIEQMKTNVDLVIQKAKIDAQIAVAEINTKAQSAAERAQIYLEVYKELHGSAHEAGMQATEHAHAQQLAQQQAQAAAQQQQSQQGADQQSQASDQTHELGMAAVQGAQQQQNGDQGGQQ